MHKFEKIKLDSGLSIIISPVKDLSTFTFIVGTKTGSTSEDENNNGISHLLEHMVFKGTKDYPTQKHLGFALENIGSNYNAFTDKEATAYYINGNIKYIEEGVKIISSMYLDPLLPVHELIKEKSIILQEIYMYHDEPSRYVGDVFESLIFGKNKLALEIAGSKESLDKIQHKDLTDYYQSHYTYDKTVIVASGNIEKNKILELIDKHFVFRNSKIEKRSNQNPYKMENFGAPRLKLIFKDTKETHLKLGFPGYSFDDKRKYALIVLSAILGQGMSSILFSKIREELGLCYYIFTESTLYKDAGYFGMQSGLNNEKIKFGIEEVLKIFKSLKDLKMTSRDLERAKNFIIGNLLISLESSFKVAYFYLTQEINDVANLETPDEFVRKLNEVTLSDIKKAITEIIKHKNLNLAIIGPYKDNKEFQDLLKIEF